MKGFVEYAKANPQKVNVAINAALGGAHMAFESFRRKVGVTYTPIYYAGEPPSIAALISGESALSIVTAPVGRPFVQDGKVNALAAMSAERFSGSAERADGQRDGRAGILPKAIRRRCSPRRVRPTTSCNCCPRRSRPSSRTRNSRSSSTSRASCRSAARRAEYAKIVNDEFNRNEALIKELRDSGQVPKQ